METTKIIRLKNLCSTAKKIIYGGQKECASLWNFCVAIHKEAREGRDKWPTTKLLREQSKNTYSLHSQTVQSVIDRFQANIDSTRENRKKNKNWRYPRREKVFYHLSWPKQAVTIYKNRILLPMGRGRKSLILSHPEIEKIDTGACQIVWNNGYELHITQKKEKEEKIKSENKACIDFGEIHLASVATNTTKSRIYSGRKIRSHKRLINKSTRKASKKTQNCKKGSRKSKKIHRAKRKIIDREKRRIRDERHKVTSHIVAFLKKEKISKVYVGDPHGVRKKSKGKNCNQKLAGWEYGKDYEYINYKCKIAGIKCFNGHERGTSSHCPECGNKQKPKGRDWKCRECHFIGHRDVVGSINMFPIAFDQKAMYPTDIMYLRSSHVERSSSSLGTGQSCLDDGTHVKKPSNEGVALATSQVCASV